MCEVAWEEVERESMGDHHMASAYCLIYLDKSQREWISEWADMLCHVEFALFSTVLYCTVYVVLCCVVFRV